jgi:integrase/recombinase XerC
MSSYKIFLRTDRTNSDGTNSLYLLFISGRIVKKFTLKIKVKQKDWNEKKCEVKKSDPDHLFKNQLISKKSLKAKEIINKFLYDEKPLSVYEFERNFNNQTFNSNSFYDFFKTEMKTLDVSEGTQKNYLKQLSKLKSFKKELYFSDINLKFLKEYNHFLKTERSNNDNTRKAALNFLRQAINKARKQGVTDINPFLNYTIGTIKGNKENLTRSELDKLEALHKTDKLVNNERAVLEYFLFACYTGVRVSDLTELKYKNIESDVLDGTEYRFLVFISQKTKKLTEVPLMPFSEKFIKPSDFPNKKIFNVFTGQGTNRVLKRIMTKAKINKHITIHSARYTFISVGSELGMRGEILQEIAKHSKLDETMGYMNVSRRAMIEEMRKFDKK